MKPLLTGFSASPPEPNLNPPDDPNWNDGAGVSSSAGAGAATGAAPGLGVSQATHFMASAGLEIMQTSHTQEPPTWSKGSYF